MKDSEVIRELPIGTKFRVYYDGTERDYIRDVDTVVAEDSGAHYEFEKFDGWEGQSISVIDD